MRELLPPAFDTPLLRGVGKKGRDPKSISDMGGAKVGSVNAMPDCIIPERGQVTEHSGEPSTVGSRNEFWHVLHDRDFGSKFANKPRELSPKTGAFAINARSLASLGQVLTGKTATDGIDCDSVSSQPCCGKLADIGIAGDIRPVLSEDFARELFDFTEGDGFEATSTLQSKREAADPRKEIEHFEFGDRH